MRRFTSFGLAAILSLAIAAPALAINETFSVNASLSMIGLPASIAYGAVDPGANSSSVQFQAVIAANTPWRLDTVGSDFTGPGGGLNKNVRYVNIFNIGGCTPQAGLDVYRSYGDTRLTDSVADASGNAAATCEITQRITPPANAAAGGFSGSVTWVLSAS